MKAKLLSAHGYQGDAMNLPVADADATATYYVEKMGFAVVECSHHPVTDAVPPLLGQEGSQQRPVKRVVLERDGIQMALAENGGDPEQDGCAFRTDNIAALRDEFIANGLVKIGDIADDTQGGKKFRVFFVVAPDGLCYWFGEEQKSV